MKVCTKCGISKPPTEFHKNRARPGGLRTDCKVCVNARSNAWNRANPERHLANVLLWQKKYPDRVKALEMARQLRDGEERRVKARVRYWMNPEKHRAASQRWKNANPDKARAKDRAWHRLNLDLVAAYACARRARKLQATPRWANEDVIKNFFAIARKKKRETGESWHVDHIIPLKSPLVCGLHVEHNLQVITGSENDRKSNHHWPDMP